MREKNIKRGFFSILFSLVMLCLVFGCSSSEKSVELQGAGATFPYPLYSKMFHEYYKLNETKINYQSIGSGGGIRQLKNYTVDFGATDAFMKDKDLKDSKQPILHIPICVGAVSLSFNLPGLDSLNLSSEVLADLYLGKIKRWNDPAIQALNNGVNLPNLDVMVVYRSDGSGTTFIFTDFLSKISNDWLTQVGRGKSINWPVGLGGKGNAGVAGIVKSTPGSIGYVGNIYATQNKMPAVSVQNSSGNFIPPTIEAVSLAADVDMPADTRVSITNTSSPKGYPISGFTWIILYQDQLFNGRSLQQAKATKELLEWMVTDGQVFAQPLDYAPLAKTVVDKAQVLLDSITYDGASI